MAQDVFNATTKAPPQLGLEELSGSANVAPSPDWKQLYQQERERTTHLEHRLEHTAPAVAAAEARIATAARAETTRAMCWPPFCIRHVSQAVQRRNAIVISLLWVGVLSLCASP